MYSRRDSLRMSKLIETSENAHMTVVSLHARHHEERQPTLFTREVADVGKRWMEKGKACLLPSR